MTGKGRIITSDYWAPSYGGEPASARNLRKSRVTVEIMVSVLDGMHGRPAEGVQVSLVIRQVGEPAIRVGGLTSSRGNFRYSSGAEGQVYAENCGVLIDVDAYFTSLGIVAGYKQIALQVRLANTDDECHIVTIITPFAHVAASIR